MDLSKYALVCFVFILLIIQTKDSQVATIIPVLINTLFYQKIARDLNTKIQAAN